MYSACDSGTMMSVSPWTTSTGSFTSARAKPHGRANNKKSSSRRVHLATHAVEQVVEEHLPHLRTGEHRLVAGWHDAGKRAHRLLPERSQHLDRRPERALERAADERHDRCDGRHPVDEAARRSVLALARGHAPEGHRGRHPIAEGVGAGQGIGAATGEPHHAEPVDAERRDDLVDVAGPVDDGLVAVGGRHADARSFDHHEPKPLVVGQLSGQWGQLPAATGCAVEPEDRSAIGRPVLGHPQLASVGQLQCAQEPGRYHVPHVISLHRRPRMGAP